MEDRFKLRIYKKAEKQMVYDVTYLNPLVFDKRINEYADNYVIMQCTGLKDKNEKLIYESDIVKLYNCVTLACVMWHRDKYQLGWSKPARNTMNIVNKRPDDIEPPKHKFSLVLGIPSRKDWSNCLILGNIWENPELIERKYYD